MEASMLRLSYPMVKFSTAMRLALGYFLMAWSISEVFIFVTRQSMTEIYNKSSLNR